MTRWLARLLLFLLLLAGTQATRFSNTITLHYDHQLLRVAVGNEEFSVSTPQTSFGQISATFQRSAVSETGLWRATVNGSPVIDRHCLYLFGRELTGEMLGGTYAALGPTLGDWSIDRFNSSPVPILTLPLGGSFDASFSFLGRGDVVLHLATDSTPVELHLRDGLIDNDFSICAGTRCPVSVSRKESSLQSFNRLLNPLLEWLLVGAALLLLFTSGALRPSYSQGAPARTWYLCLAAVSGLTLLVCLWFNYTVLGGIPHIPDSSVYYRQAILLSEGMLKAPYPPFEPISLFIPNGAVRFADGFAFHYPRFWPALLAPFVLLSVAPMLNPLLAAGVVWLLGLLGRRLFSPRAGLIAAALGALSPLVVLMGGDFMSHSATAFLFLVGLHLLLRFEEEPRRFELVLFGICWSYAFAIRPLTVAVLAAVALIFYGRPLLSRRALWSSLGALPVLLLMLADNYSLTGAAFVSPYARFHRISFSLGNLAQGLNNVDSTFAFLQPLLFAPPLSFVLWGFVGLGVLARAGRGSAYCFASFLVVLASHSFLNTHGMHGYGPRFLYEGSLLLLLLAASGIEVAMRNASTALGRYFIAVTLLSCLVLGAYHTYLSLPAYHNYNSISSDVLTSIRASNHERAIIVTSDTTWRGMDATTVLWDPNYKELLTVTEAPDDSHLPLLAQLRDRPAYHLEGASLAPYLWWRTPYGQKLLASAPRAVPKTQPVSPGRFNIGQQAGFAIAWILWFEVVTLWGVLLLAALFPALPDKGVGLAKVLGFFAFGYSLWWLRSVQILTASNRTALAMLLVLTIGAVVLFRRTVSLRYPSPEATRSVISSQLFFWFLFLVFLGVRSIQP